MIRQILENGFQAVVQGQYLIHGQTIIQHPGRQGPVETQGMIGYMIEQELGNLLPMEVPFATLLTMIEVDPHDPAFADPAKFFNIMSNNG